MHFPSRPDRENALWLHVLVVLAACLVFSPVLIHPGWLLFSEHSDILGIHYPFRWLLSEGVARHGALALWDPYQFCGEPLIGDPQSGLFYPPNWLHALVPPQQTAALFGWISLFHVIVAGTGVLFWLRGWGFSAAASLGGAFVFMFSGKWFLHCIGAGHVGFLPLAWLPWQLLLVDCTGRRPTVASSTALALITAAGFMGYHPQIFFYSSLILITYALVILGRTPSPRRWLSAALLALSAVLALGLTMIQFLPVRELLPFLGRSGTASYSFVSFWSLEPSDLITFVVPDARGTEITWEQFAYIGLLPLTLAPFSLADGRRRAVTEFFLLVSVVGVLYALGPSSFLHRFVYDHLPLFGYFRLPARAVAVLGLPAAWITAAGITGLLAMPLRFASLGCACLALAGVAVRLGYSTPASVLSTAVLMAPAASLLARRFNPGAAAMLLAGAALVESVAFCAPLIQVRPMDAAVVGGPLVAWLDRHPGQYRVEAPDRRYPGENVLPPTRSVPGHIQMVRGFNVVPRSVYEYVDGSIGGELLGDNFREFLTNYPIVNRGYFDLLGVRYVCSPGQMDLPGFVRRDTLRNVPTREPHSPGVDTEHITIYENVQVKSRVLFFGGLSHPPSADDIKRGQDQPVPCEATFNGLSASCHVDASGYLLITEFHYPGWKATDNGSAQAVESAVGNFCAVHLEPGDHRLTLSYCPESYLSGQRVSLGTLLLCLILAGCEWLWKRNNSQGLEPRPPGSISDMSSTVG